LNKTTNNKSITVHVIVLCTKCDACCVIKDSGCQLG